jgi:hypothetical protein
MNPRPLALAALIVLAALTRLVPHPPNFAPICAIAVFGAARFVGWRIAVTAPLFALLASDLAMEVLHRYGQFPVRGLYRGMWAVYGATALVAVIGRFARGSHSPGVIAGSTLAGSCLFFALTNFAVWALGTRYPHTGGGLAACYAAALPFFRNAILGDFFYATVLFGGWALVESRFPTLRPSPVAAK